MDTDEVLLLGSGFCGLPGKKRAEILGIVKALSFAQAGQGRKAKAPINTITGAHSRSLGKTVHARQRVPAL
ncbi:hypothetical protein AGMMS4952_01350 [Spirochaetia bacterium]|nr:hypothetical protein AGMMS4952_01350 [Spirochaetia bacterium]